METRLQDDDKIALAFDDLPEAEKFFAGLEEQQGFFLQLERELKQFQRLAVTATASGGFRFRFNAEAVQVFPAGGSYGTAFQLVDWTPARDKELRRKLKAGESADGEGEMGTSPIFRIRKMDPNQRFRLAVKASRPERTILIRDNSPQVLLGLLSHPRIEDREVKAIVDSAFSTGAIMQRVASNRKWMSNAEIQLAVVRSPKTPPPLAIKLMPTLRTSDLRALAKGSMSRETIRRAALKVYMQRTRQR